MRSLVTSVLQSTSEIIEDPFKMADETLRLENARLNKELEALRINMLELEQMADTDPLVPLYNRRAFIRELSRAQTVRHRYNIASSVIYFDLDKFKAINDQFGHAAGDKALKAFAKVIENNIRDCDVAARIGGDEFAVLLFKTDIDQAMVKAVSVAQQASNINTKLDTLNIELSVSWGVADCMANVDPEDVLSKADRQMLSCKSVPAMKMLSRRSL